VSDDQRPESATGGVTEFKPRKAAAAPSAGAGDGSASQDEAKPSSTKPYLIRAIHEWCTDNGLTPYLSVVVDGRCQVPHEFVKNGEIVLNVGYLATNKLKIGNDRVEFSARFGGRAREVVIPIDQVAAIYSRENGHGMGFEIPQLRSEHTPPTKPALSDVNNAAGAAQVAAEDDPVANAAAVADGAPDSSAEAHGAANTATVAIRDAHMPATNAAADGNADAATAHDDGSGGTVDSPTPAATPQVLNAPQTVDTSPEPLPSNVSALKKPGRAKLTVVK
jgi:stringent starvation protein B